MSWERVERSLHDPFADVACVSVQMEPAMNASRPWLVVVLALFCLPLFVGLGRGDPLFRSRSGGWLNRARRSIPCDSSVPPLAAKISRKPSRSWSKKNTAHVTYSRLARPTSVRGATSTNTLPFSL